MVTGLGSPIFNNMAYVLPAADAARSALTPVNASITANGSSTQTLTVTAKDIDGNNLSTGGSTVTITRLSGTGTISPVIDNNNGTYTAAVTSPTSTGSGVFVATLGGLPIKSGTGSQTQATVNYIAGSATKLVFGQQPANTAAGSQISPTVTVQIHDTNGNLISNDNSTQITLSIGNNAGGGTLSGTKIVTASGGVATFDNLSIDKTGQGYTLSAASSPTLTGVTSNPFNITPGPFDHFTITGYPTTVNSWISLRKQQCDSCRV